MKTLLDQFFFKALYLFLIDFNPSFSSIDCDPFPYSITSSSDIAHIAPSGKYNTLVSSWQDW